MRPLLTLAAACAAALAGTSAAAGPSNQPPMNNLDFAYYTCANGGAFLISYDAREPSSATMTTSNDNRSYALKRTSVEKGVRFTGPTASFWTDGKTVVVNGTQKPLLKCMIKPN